MSEEIGFAQPDEKDIKNIINNYIQNEKALINQLYLAISHNTTIGSFREDIWRSMFEQIIPKKFVIEQSVFIIDSEGRISNEVDLAIFDETYTPYIFRYSRLKFIPIEAVAVVIECKSQSLDQEKLENWAKSVAALTTSRKSYTRTATGILVGEIDLSKTQTQTRPLRILCCLNETIVNKRLPKDEKLFDIIVRAPSEQEELKIEIDEEKASLKDWYLALNHVGFQQSEDGSMCNGDAVIHDGVALANVTLKNYEVCQGKKSVSLLSFNFQFNQLLMLINNPIPFPHLAYAEMFRKFAEGEGANE